MDYFATALATFCIFSTVGVRTGIDIDKWAKSFDLEKKPVLSFPEKLKV